MKPITDDIVLSLIEGAKKRQAGTQARVRYGGLGARIIDLADHNGKPASDLSGRVISLDVIRRAGVVRRTVSGVFCYAPRP